MPDRNNTISADEIPAQSQDVPGNLSKMKPRPDHGEESYKGHGRLKGRKALITGGDSGIGRAVAIAFAREGADVALSYLNEDRDAEDTAGWVREAGQEALCLPGDISSPEHCRAIVERTADAFGCIDILVNNAAYQMAYETLEEIEDSEWEKTFAVNIHAMFYLTKAALPHMPEGASIINTTSVNADMPNQILVPYATTKGAIQNFTGGLAQLLAGRGIRVNCVAPGPVWTPLIPATLPEDKVEAFGKNYPMGRPAQPVELSPAYVMLASHENSYMSGATLAVTGGKPFL